MKQVTMGRYEASILKKWPSIVSDTYPIPILSDTRIGQLILFLKKINDRYVFDTSPIRVSEKYRVINVL
jgi:hypothetical protein